WVDVSGHETLVMVSQAGAGMLMQIEDLVPRRRAGDRFLGTAPYGFFACRDRLVCLLAIFPEHWDALARWIAEETGLEAVLRPPPPRPHTPRPHTPPPRPSRPPHLLRRPPPPRPPRRAGQHGRRHPRRPAPRRPELLGRGRPAGLGAGALARPALSPQRNPGR